MELDVVIVGAGPAGLATAIELAQLAKRDGTELNIGVLEKAGALGEHCLSGAVVNPRAFRELFPGLHDSDFPFRAPVRGEAVYLLTANRRLRLPTPPTMRNKGNYVASLCEIVRWLGEKAEALGVNIFTGFRRRACSWTARGWQACARRPQGSTVRATRSPTTLRRTTSS